MRNAYTRSAHTSRYLWSRYGGAVLVLLVGFATLVAMPAVAEQPTTDAASQPAAGSKADSEAKAEAATAPAPLEWTAEELELFRLLVTAHVENLERITTWKGKATVVSSRIESGGADEEEEADTETDAEANPPKRDPNRAFKLLGKIEFVVDTSQGCKRWRHETAEVLRGKSEKDLVPDVKFFKENYSLPRDQMFRPDGIFECQKGLRRTLDNGEYEYERTLVIIPADEAYQRFHPFAFSFDPMWYLGSHESGNSWLGQFTYWRDRPDVWKGREGRIFSVTREGDVVTVESINSNGTFIDTFRYDLAKGGNCIEHTQVSMHQQAMGAVAPRISEFKTLITYEKKAGVWVPKTWVRTHTSDNGKGGIDRSERFVTFDEQEVNSPITSDELTAGAMGVHEGARVTDHLRMVFYEYGREEKTTRSLSRSKNESVRPGELFSVPDPAAGVDKYFLVCTPQMYDATKAWPVIFYYHGVPGAPTVGDMRLATGWENFIVVGMSYSKPGPIDFEQLATEDVRIFRHVLGRMKELCNVDEKKLYVAGFDKGGVYACEMLRLLAPELAGALVWGSGSENLDLKKWPDLTGKAVYIGVGERDSKLPAAKATEVHLAKLGASVLFDKWPDIAHEICDVQNRKPLREWLVAQAERETEPAQAKTPPPPPDR